MPQIDSTIFRKNDIRGVAMGDNSQLTPEIAGLVGKSLGTYLPKNFQTERIFIGCDNRLSSPKLKVALIEGVLSTGLDVIDIGEVLTPMVYFASASYGDKGAGVMITGSHLPIEHNGVKMVYGDLALAAQQILGLLEIIQKGVFATARTSKVSIDADMAYKYIAQIKGKVNITKPLSVVLDAGNGLSGTYIPPLLKELGMTVYCLYCESDGTYPNHLPNPEESELMKELGAKVVELGADLGLAFDGDADRFGLVDNHGRHIASDRLVVPLARDLLKGRPNATIVLDVKTSQVVYDEIKKYGGTPVMWKTGHSLTMQKMREVGSLLGSDAHGHLYIGEGYFGFDDAPLAALKLLEIIAESSKTAAELFNEIPSLVTTPEIILPTPDSVKFRIIDNIKLDLQKQYAVIEVDGARALFKNGWGLVRASNSQPAITMRFEAYERGQLVEYMQGFKELLDQYPEINQQRLVDQIEAFSS